MIIQKGELLHIDIIELVTWVFITQDTHVVALDKESAEDLAYEILRYLENKSTPKS